jgi:hypothetical protein
LEEKVKVKKKGMVIPKELFMEMVGTYVKMEQILATVESLADEETLKSIEEGKKQVSKGEYVECSINDLEKFLIICPTPKDSLKSFLIERNSRDYCLFSNTVRIPRSRSDR